MTKIVKQGANRAYAAGKSAKHAQRTPLPPREGPQRTPADYSAETAALREALNGRKKNA